jgi:hypothetical protein
MIAPAGTATFTHGLGRPPKELRLVVVRTAAGNDDALYGTPLALTQYDEMDADGLHSFISAGNEAASFNLKTTSTSVLIFRGDTGTNQVPYVLGAVGAAAYFESDVEVTFAANYKLKLYYS